MSVSTTTSKIVYTGDGSTTVFPYNFYIFADSDLTVTKVLIADGTETVLTLTTDYTVSGAGVATGGNVTLGTAIASTYKLVIQRSLSKTQGSDYEAYGPLPSDTLETNLDKLTMITQELQEQIDRSLIASITETSGYTLPSASANKFLGWNALGTGLENKSATGVSDGDAIHDNVASEISGITEKTSLAADDLFLIEDSAASNVKKKVKKSNITSSDSNAIHDNVSGEISAITEKVSPADADLVIIEDSAASNVKKKVQIGNIGSAVTVSKVAGTSDINTVSTSYVDMTDMSLSLTGTGTYIFTFEAPIKLSPTGLSYIKIALDIDGVDVVERKYGTYSISGENPVGIIHTGIHWVVDITTESTAKIQWLTSTGTTYQYGTDSTRIFSFQKIA